MNPPFLSYTLNWSEMIKILHIVPQHIVYASNFLFFLSHNYFFCYIILV